MDFIAEQYVERLMRRAALALLSLGLIAIPVIWLTERRDGSLQPFNAISMPVMETILLISLTALVLRPSSLVQVRWVAFVSVSVHLMTELWVQLAVPVAITTNYNAITLLTWLPLCYALAFLLLDLGHAVLAAGCVLAFMGFCGLMRSNVDSSYSSQDSSLMINTFLAHLLLVTCLTGLLWLKRAVRLQSVESLRIEVLSETDALTGLANRRQVSRRLEAIIRRGKSPLAPLALIADLDHFKRINDSHGHPTGDRVLAAAAAALRSAVRDSDVVARWGGEEFLVLVSDPRSTDVAELSERLRTQVERLRVPDSTGGDLSVTVSIGVAALVDGESAESWLKRADTALYAAKEQGRNRCVVSA